MNLQPTYFDQIARGSKTIEVRLNNEKRRALHLGDVIVFSNPANEKLLTTTTEKLDVHPTFAQLFETAPAAKFGLSPEGTLPNMYEFYTKEDETKYGVVGIHLSSVTPATTQELTLTAYNHDLDGYLAKLPPDEVVQKTIDEIIPHLQPKSTILEIGSDTGRDADYLETKDFTVIRTDFAQSFIDFQKLHNKKVTPFNILKETYTPPQDAILLNGVFVHFTRDEVQQALTHCHASLREKGMLCINTKDGEGEELVTNMAIPRFMKKWNQTELSHMITEKGFTILKTIPSADNAWCLYLAQKHTI